MGNTILGVVLIVAGVLALLAGVAGGVLTLFLDIRKRVREERAAGAIELLPLEYVKALTEFLNALVKAPQWLILMIVGVGLIVWGSTML
jgi:hypothetical protein